LAQAFWLKLVLVIVVVVVVVVGAFWAWAERRLPQTRRRPPHASTP